MAGIFKAYDIRGIYGKTLTEDVATDVGRAFVTFLKCRKVVVGQDRVVEHLLVAVFSGGHVLLTGLLFLGLATTFGILWLLRKTQPTGWAKYPAVGFLAMAVLFIVEGARFSEYWLATTLLVFGVTGLLAVLIGKRPAAGQQVPKVKA